MVCVRVKLHLHLTKYIKSQQQQQKINTSIMNLQREAVKSLTSLRAQNCSLTATQF